MRSGVQDQRDNIVRLRERSKGNPVAILKLKILITKNWENHDFSQWNEEGGAGIVQSMDGRTDGASRTLTRDPN